MKIKFKAAPGAFTPKMAHDGDAAADLFMPYNHEPVKIRPWQSAFIDSGISIEGVEGYHIDVRSRSGLAIKNHIVCFNGLIDSNYTGSIGIMLFNFGNEDYTIQPGDRIAQIILVKQESMEFEKVEKLAETNRGENGFGSSGK